MAIRDIVTRGFGNGTYDPGVNDLPTRGYSLAIDYPGSLACHTSEAIGYTTTGTEAIGYADQTSETIGLVQTTSEAIEKC